MGYALLALGILGMIGSWLVYRKAAPRDFWYEAALLSWIVSWLVWVFGIWMVTA